jgi:hypothetical protein
VKWPTSKKVSNPPPTHPISPLTPPRPLQTQCYTNGPPTTTQHTLWSSSPTSLRVFQDFDPQNPTFPYTFSITSGTNIDIYMVHSGIHTAHADFEGCATFLAFFSDEVKGDDNGGHGMHVVGMSTGLFFGMAKKANLLDDQGAGPISDITSGLNVVLQRVASLWGTRRVRGVMGRHHRPCSGYRDSAAWKSARQEGDG